MAVFLAITDTVGNKIDKKTHHHRLVGPHEDMGGNIGLNGNVFLIRDDLLFLGNDFEEFAQVNRFQMKVLVSAVRSGQGKELGNQGIFLHYDSIKEAFEL